MADHAQPHAPSEREVLAAVPQAEDALARAEALVVKDEQSLVTATEYAAQIKGVLDQQEAARDRLVRPLNEHVKWINGVFKDAAARPASVIGSLREKIGTYHQAKQEEAARLRRESEEQAEAVRAAQDVGLIDQDAPVPAAVDVQPTRTAGHATSGSTQVSDVWDYEITDLESLVVAIAAGDALLDWIQPDRGAIRRDMNATVRNKQEPKSVPGLRFFKKTSVAIRRNPR